MMNLASSFHIYNLNRPLKSLISPTNDKEEIKQKKKTTKNKSPKENLKHSGKSNETNTKLKTSSGSNKTQCKHKSSAQFNDNSSHGKSTAFESHEYTSKNVSPSPSNIEATSNSCVAEIDMEPGDPNELSFIVQEGDKTAKPKKKSEIQDKSSKDLVDSTKKSKPFSSSSQMKNNSSQKTNLDKFHSQSTKNVIQDEELSEMKFDEGVQSASEDTKEKIKVSKMLENEFDLFAQPSFYPPRANNCNALVKFQNNFKECACHHNKNNSLEQKRWIDALIHRKKRDNNCGMRLVWPKRSYDFRNVDIYDNIRAHCLTRETDWLIKAKQLNRKCYFHKNLDSIGKTYDLEQNNNGNSHRFEYQAKSSSRSQSNLNDSSECSSGFHPRKPHESIKNPEQYLHYKQSWDVNEKLYQYLSSNFNNDAGSSFHRPKKTDRKHTPRHDRCPRDFSTETYNKTPTFIDEYKIKCDNKHNHRRSKTYVMTNNCCDSCSAASTNSYDCCAYSPCDQSSCNSCCEMQNSSCCQDAGGGGMGGGGGGGGGCGCGCGGGGCGPCCPQLCLMPCNPCCCCDCSSCSDCSGSDSSSNHRDHFGMGGGACPPLPVTGACAPPCPCVENSDCTTPYCDESYSSNEVGGFGCPCRCPQFVRPPPYCLSTTYRLNYYQKCIPKFRRYQECDNLRLPLC